MTRTRRPVAGKADASAVRGRGWAGCCTAGLLTKGVTGDVTGVHTLMRVRGRAPVRPSDPADIRLTAATKCRTLRS
ncbi:hypothetical protein GCM10010405_17100 [Streptomyces macrosporus]|uniref:Uncharacterized protein n=1 Tax=Streptomyces macrosporus TaxID=44032 RepID=A0ABN3JQ54_9ACTN